MLGIEVSSGVLTAVIVSLVPIGAAFLGWIVLEMRTVAEINARTTQRLGHLEERLDRIEGIVWRPAWGPGPNGGETK